jgi:hypothetical protein
VSVTQQANDPEADNVVTAQDEVAEAEEEQQTREDEESGTIDETVSLAAAPPAELGVIKTAKGGAKAAAKGAATGGAAKGAATGGAAKAAAAGKPIPAELGFIPKKGGAGKGGAGKGGAGKGKGGKSNVSADNDRDAEPKKSDWPIDNFPPGLYAPNGLPYPNVRAAVIGPFNEFSGLHENPDGTRSFPDGAIVDAPNTWLMTDDNVVPVDDYSEELTMAEKEQHEREILNAKNQAAYNKKERARLHSFLQKKKAEREFQEEYQNSFNQFTGLYTNPVSGHNEFADGS